jgi:tetratricopeptide (TPR) repeat protein
LFYNLLADAALLAFGVYLYHRLTEVSPYRQRRAWKDWARAIPELEHALALNPDSLVLRQRLAGYLLAGGEGSRALEEIQKAEELAPGDRWNEFYRQAALVRLEGGSSRTRESEPLPAVAGLNPGLFKALSGR